MKNWKTTAWGWGAAILLIGITYLVKHDVDYGTLLVAAGMAGIGTNASDAKTDIETLTGAVAQLPQLKTLLGSPLAKDGVQLADQGLTLADASHPTNVLLGEIKTGLDTLNSSVAPPVVTDPAKAK